MPTVTTKKRYVRLRVPVNEQIHLLIYELSQQEYRNYDQQAKHLMAQGLGWRPTTITTRLQEPGKTRPITIDLKLTLDEAAALDKAAVAQFRTPPLQASYAINRALGLINEQETNANV